MKGTLYTTTSVVHYLYEALCKLSGDCQSRISPRGDRRIAAEVTTLLTADNIEAEDSHHVVDQ